MLREAPCCRADGIMNPPLSSLVAFVGVLAGALFGMFRRNKLPKGYLQADTKGANEKTIAARSTPLDTPMAPSGHIGS
jgi:hypothetical protein